MLERLFTSPVELTVNDKTVLFNSIEDFKFSLDARTSIPLDKITDTINSSLGELLLELEAIDTARKKLSKLLSQSPEVSSGINMRLKSTNLAIFTKDNGWRDIMTGLNQEGSIELCKYKQIALKTYLQYLSNRSDMIKSIQTALEKMHVAEDLKEDDFSVSQLRTGSLDISKDPEIHHNKEGMVSMVRGKPVIVKIKEGDKIELLLSEHKCELIVKDGIKFIDYNNIEYPIEIGKNKIGRGHDCSVKFQDGEQEISRLHIVIVNHDHKKLEITDLSSHGTYYRHISA